MYHYIDYIVECITLCNNEKVDLKIINYSKVESIEKSLLDILFDGNSFEFLKQARYPKIKNINRSLTRVEYEIQRQFNKHLGKNSSSFISDFLVQNAPNIRSEKEYIDECHLNRFIEKNIEKVRFINEFLDDKNQLELSMPSHLNEKSLQSDIYKISSEQIAVMVEGISKKILQQNSADLLGKDAEILRDIALKFEKDPLFSLKDAYYLMSYGS